MKIFANIMKVVAALTAVVGAVYVVAAYGDKIVAWAKGLCDKYGHHEAQFFDPEDAPTEEDLRDVIEPLSDEPADPDQAADEDFEI